MSIFFDTFPQFYSPEAYLVYTKSLSSSLSVWFQWSQILLAYIWFFFPFWFVFLFVSLMCIHAWLCVCTCVHACMYVCVHIYMCKYVHKKTRGWYLASSLIASIMFNEKCSHLNPELTDSLSSLSACSRGSSFSNSQVLGLQVGFYICLVFMRVPGVWNEVFTLVQHTLWHGVILPAPWLVLLLSPSGTVFLHSGCR